MHNGRDIILASYNPLVRKECSWGFSAGGGELCLAAPAGQHRIVIRLDEQSPESAFVNHTINNLTETFLLACLDDCSFSQHEDVYTQLAS
jgi:hypothetical protein